MANVKVNWVLPDTRDSGKPLNVGEIDFVSISISSDGGANFGEYGQYEPSVLETTVTDLEPGEWFFSGVVVDIGGKSSKTTKASIVVPDDTPPGALLLLTLTL